MNLEIAISIYSSHETFVSWRPGVDCSENQEFRMASPFSPVFSDLYVSVTEKLQALTSSFACLLRFSPEVYCGCSKSFFIESPFVKRVEDVIVDVFTVFARLFRVMVNTFLSTGSVPQAKLAMFQL